MTAFFEGVAAVLVTVGLCLVLVAFFEAAFHDRRCSCARNGRRSQTRVDGVD